MSKANSLPVSGKLLPSISSCLLLLCLMASMVVAHAQKLQSRIAGPIADGNRSLLAGSRSPLARAQNDMGRVDTSLPLEGMTLVFARSQAQQRDLDALLIAQQDASSPLYHAWLAPEQFGARFGMSDADLSKATAWLQQQGFTVNSVSRSRDAITFSGTVARAEVAFQTEIHQYLIAGETKFAPSSEISLPVALSAVTSSVTNLTSIRPRPHIRMKKEGLTPNFNSSQSLSHFLTPGDIRTIYDINPAYNAGYTGSGQSIAVVGQSAIIMSDIEHFQSAAGLTVKDPALVLVPNTGASTVYSNDESESDLDLEYSGAIAPGATIRFVYTGNSNNSSVLDAERYAIQNNLAPIVSISYGECEQVLGATEYASENSIFQQAAAQGQTVVAASGDDGSSDCVAYGVSGLYADFPASSQYVTGLGGTEFSSANVAAVNTTYWKAASGSDVISSALSYIPEQVWNDSTASGLSAGGGGTSMFTARPSWQTGVTGIPSGGFRLVPDVSLTSSPNDAGYLYCSSDTSSTGITGSCANGFRDANNAYLTLAGGTSFAAPIFAGMVALINQSTSPSGQGVVNQKLYALAANSATYASAFHDVTAGTNACYSGYRYCVTPAAGSYSATTGYDEATGLGSVDLYNLLTAWPSASITTLAPSTVSLSPATSTPASGASDVITINVASGSSSSTATPTGTVTISVDGTSVTTTPLAGSAASFTFSSGISGMHTVAAAYSGDTNFASSTSSVTLTISAGSVVSTTTVSATTLNPASGATDAISINVASGSSGSTAIPTGVLTITDKYSSSTTTTLALSGGAATYNFSSNASGTHILTFVYSGDTTFAGSSASVTLVIPVVIVPSFTLTASNVSLLASTSFASAITINPTNYQGTVKWTATGPSNLTNTCYSIPNTVVQGTTSAAMTIYTNASACTNLAPLGRNAGLQASLSAYDGTSTHRVLFAWILTGAFALCGLRTRRLRGFLLGAAGMVLLGMMSGCGSGGSSSTPTTTSSTNAPVGVYTITLTGTDTVTSGVTAKTTFTLTVN